MVRPLMGEYGISLRALARTVNYDPSALSKVMSGRKPCPPRLAELIDEALDAGGAVEEAAAAVRDQLAADRAAAREPRYVVLQLTGIDGQTVPVAVNRRSLAAGAVASAEEAPREPIAQVAIAGVPELSGDSQATEGTIAAPHPRREIQIAVPLDPPEEDVDRRQLLRVFGGMAVAPLIAGIDRPRRELENSIDPVTTSADAGEWDRVVLQYTSEVGRVPPMQIIPDLHVDFDEAQLRLANSADVLRTRMMRVCGQLSALMAISFTNIGEFRAANRYWRSAIRAVDETNDRELQSLIRGRRAVFALYDDKAPPSSILSLSGEAIEIGRGIACAGVASAYAARAQTLALLGQHEESENAVRDLTGLFERLPGYTATDRTSQWGWSEQRLRHVESHVYSYAGQFDKASAAQEAALALYPKDRYQGRTQVELYRSICITRSGDPTEGARHVIRTVQSLPASRQNDALVRRTAALALKAMPASAANLSAVLEARGMLALTEGAS